jgi:hypothetical protein
MFTFNGFIKNIPNQYLNNTSSKDANKHSGKHSLKFIFPFLPIRHLF